MQNIASYLLRAKQKSGKPHAYVQFVVEDGDDAETILSYLIMKAKLVKNDYFAAVRIDFPVVDGLPGDGEFSETFWLEWALEGETGKTCVPRATLDPTIAFPKLYPYMLKADADKPAKTPEPPAKEDAKYFATNLDKHTVIAAAWQLGRDCLQLNDEQLRAAKTLLMDDSQRYPQNVIMALSSLKQFDYVYPEMPIVAIAGIKAVWPPFGKAPEIGKLCQFATEYLDAKNEDRPSIILKWQSGPSGTALTSQNEELPRTSSGALASTGKKPAYGTPIASFSELETVTYLAHYPSDFDISRPPIGIVNAVKEMKTRKEKSPLAWYGQLSETPGILDFSREAVGTLIRNAPETLHLTPGPLRDYINANLIEIDDKTAKVKTHAQTQSLPQGEAGSLADEQLENESLAGAAAGVSSTALAGELVSMGSGQFDVSALFEASPLKDASTEPAPEIASNAGEKEEVDAVSDLEPTTRSAWLRREIMRALEGKTSVMSVIDVEELIVNTGGLNNAYLARLLAKEIEPCDPFKQLVEDDIYHLTCDVLEGWLDDKSQRIDLINERIESYLRDGSAEPQSVTLENKEAVEVSTPVSETAPEEIASEAAEPAVTYPAYFEPGRYHDIPNDVYHAANGISSTQVKDARISLMYFHGRHVIKSIQRERTDALTFGSLVHTLALEPDKLDAEFSVEPLIPEGAFTDTASMRAFIDKHNSALPKQADADTLRSIIEKHNATLPVPYALGGNADEIGQFYTLLPAEFQRIGEEQKPTASAMKACIKEFNATLPVPLKTSGSRDALLEQLESIDPEFVEEERAIPAPLSVSGSKEEMAARIKTILPTAIFADELISAWKSNSDQRKPITQAQMKHAKAIQYALLSHPLAGLWLQHPQRATEVSYFGIDENTGLDVRIRPDLEVDTGARRIAIDLKTVSLPYVKQDNLRHRLHREIIERDYHMSAGMYCDVGMFDQFFWIFVNKEPGYHWVAVIEASADELALGCAIYKQQLVAIRNAMDTGIWPEPITEVFTDTLTDYELSRLKELNGEPS